ncbi:RNA polymerase, sigma 28 subunit, FliA/WhiG subfamily [Thalassoporum mexicanum PCC 7367]|uniref:RNA polymerase sigma factor SigF n=1 Tax=Thalassoporum mexicanum TaxID=3457544 RepID=UPI00029F8F35|nr:RNA polymerase sigma factor SigF [Pseudanabaena sp. PCC 7367]AFY70167.1 RNA polymerase, sigma 28 subunit, FliA/WhiG subfamily [Pseudanabaena sp. PCC 7367]
MIASIEKTIDKANKPLQFSVAKNTLAHRQIVNQIGVRKEFSREDKSVTLELLKAYKRSPSKRIRTKLVNLNIGLVKKEVGYWSNQSAESYEDLLQVGSIGLIGAIERFELNRGYAFSSFATRYIRGEIQHYLRDKSSTLRIPRRWMDLHNKSIRAAQQLRRELRREPSDRELAAALEVSLSEWQDIKLAHQNRSPVSLDAPIRCDEANGTCLAELVPDPKHCLQVSQEDSIRLHQALGQLEERTRAIVEFVFLQDLTQREVAKMMGVSAVTISRQLKKGLESLKQVMQQQAA